MTPEEKAKNLLSAPLGCAVIMDMVANENLELELFAEPLASFWLAASAVHFCDPRDPECTERRQMAIDLAQHHAALANDLVTSPAFAWWWADLDASSQIWVSPQMPNGQNNPPEPAVPEPFAPEQWRTPRPSNDLWPDTYAQKTSTLVGATTSDVMAYALYAGDHISAFPLAAWSVQFPPDVRVFEIHSPADWHALCQAFPRHAPDGRLVPAWERVAQRWDGVHLSLGGMLSCDGVPVYNGEEWSMMEFWHSEITRWLRRIEVSGTRLPAFERTPHRLDARFRRFPYPYVAPITDPAKRPRRAPHRH